MFANFADNPKTQKDVVISEFNMCIDAIKTFENVNLQDMEHKCDIPTFTELNGLNSTWLKQVISVAMKFFARRRINQWRLLSIS